MDNPGLETPKLGTLGLSTPCLGTPCLGIPGLATPGLATPGLANPSLDIPGPHPGVCHVITQGQGTSSCVSCYDFRRLLMTSRLLSYSTTLALERDLAS